MSERQYFSIRLAVPGYTFILVVLLINHVPLVAILKDTGAPEFFGALLAFLSLFTGSALGFLTSQFWFWQYVKKGRIAGVPEIKDALKPIKKLLKPDYKECERAIGAVSDYILFRKEKKEIVLYLHSRWDMYHIFNSTSCTLIMGLIVGFCLRLYYWIFLFHGSISIYCNMGFFAEFFAQLFIVGLVVLLTLLFQCQSHTLMINLCPMLKAYIIDGIAQFKDVEVELHRVFPDYI